MTEIFESKLSQLALKLYECEAIKFGKFKMKSGSYSPIYFDLRVIISYPEVMVSVVDLLLQKASDKLKCNHLCGVPYTALPIATIMSVKTNIPMLIRRKEAKSYGTKKLIEGQFKQHDTCVIVEDVVTTGSSILETLGDLRQEKIDVKEAVIILDREQGGIANLQSHNINVTCLFTITKLLAILVDANLISAETVLEIQQYLQTSQTIVNVPLSDARLKMKFEVRSKLASNPVAKRLLLLMSEKRTNLCLAADVKTTDEILNLLDRAGPYICLLKLHIDIVEDFNSSFVDRLVKLAKQRNVLLMEDRKFGDIGNTVALQYSKGIYKIHDWADLVTVHSAPGPGAIEAIKGVQGDEPKGIFLIGEMSSEGNLMSYQYMEATMKIAQDNLTIVAGIVCQTKDLITSPGLIQLTPGVQINSSGDGLGQQYNSPKAVVLERGADVAVVGRGIINAEDVAETAKLYRDKLWESYEQRIS